MKRAIILAVSVVLICAPALADDLVDPPWPRGSDGTTLQIWQFGDPGVYDPNEGSYSYPEPDVDNNQYGVADLRTYTGVGQEWLPDWGGRDGLWPLSGLITIDIPNRQEPLPYKEIWIQLTWASQTPGSIPYLETEVPIGSEAGPPGVVTESSLGPTGEPPPVGQDWMHTTYVIRIEPNPPWEHLRIGGSIVVDQLVIDTICIPEPATVGLMALASIAVLRRRRR
jgi:hypothetical protein